MELAISTKRYLLPRPTVLYISLHQDPRTLYPRTGFVWQIGEDQGEGFNVNIPLPPGTGDQTYLYALRQVFVPLAEEFKPQIIIANGGSDPHFADSLANLSLTISGFFHVSTLIRETADKVCDGKLVLMPGSGYNPQTLPPCWYALIAGASGLSKPTIKESEELPKEPPECRPIVEETLKELRKLLKNRWTYFGSQHS
jgi:acetoin utilization deacetylase AcuC-like enzyme